ncbi:Odorant receptor 94b [Anthophora quadrimaculata]
MHVHTLKWTLKVLTFCGYFRPVSWTSPRRKFLYNVYTIFVVIILITSFISQILDIVFNVETQEELSDNFCITFSALNSLGKLSSLLLGRKMILNLIDMLQSDPLRPLNKEEMEIRSRHDRIIEKLSIAYTIPIELSAIFIWITSIFTSLKIDKLPIRVWLPFDYKSTLFVFVLTYVYQFLSTLFITIVIVGSDNLFNGLLIHVYCQFEILQHRLSNIKTGQEYTAKQCAYHHNRIYKFAKVVNEKFSIMTSVQFLVTTTTICFSLYRLTQITLYSQILSAIFFMIAAFIQIFYFCWHGNETKLKSLEISNTIFASNWMSLNESSKKILLTIMLRSMKPIELSSAFIFPINLESFKNLLKSSYSIFNVIQQA